MNILEQRAPIKDKSRVQNPVMSSVSNAFLENMDFLKNYLKRFFSQNEDIEDVTQEVYLKAFQIEQKGSIDNPKAYLFRVAKNVALNELNRKSRQMTEYIEERLASIPLDGIDSPEDRLEAQQTISLYCDAAHALPKKCRRVFLLRKVNGMSHKEIANHLGITTSAVEKHLRNGAKRCKDYIRNANHIGTQANLKSQNNGSQCR